MAENTLKGSTEGPYEQFEKCDILDCNFRNETGKCIFETCLYVHELPPTVSVWYTKCMACQEVFAIDPRYMKIRFCPSCIERMQAAEKKPFTCVFCGRKQGHNSKIFMSGICDHCFTALNHAINCKYCGNG